MSTTRQPEDCTRRCQCGAPAKRVALTIRLDDLGSIVSANVCDGCAGADDLNHHLHRDIRARGWVVTDLIHVCR